MHDFQNVAAVIALAWLATFAVAQAQHAYWRHLDFRWRYVMGTLAICGGCTAVGIVFDNVLLAIVPWVLASAGATIIINYAVEEWREKERRNDRKHGEMVGLARGLTQELIDQGGKHDPREPRIRADSSRN